jgi:hypothetical protein
MYLTFRGLSFVKSDVAITLSAPHVALFAFVLDLLVASGLRILQDFAGICRGKLGISFVFGVRGRTHNLLVPGSNPGGPTTYNQRAYTTVEN